MEAKNWVVKRSDINVRGKVSLLAREQTQMGTRPGWKAETFFRTEVAVVRGQGGIYLL